MIVRSYLWNIVGSLMVVALVAGSGLLRPSCIFESACMASTYGEVAAKIADAKMALSFGDAYVRGVLCNILVCLAVWGMVQARTVVGKFVALVLPISAFITLGFEHSVANWFLLPIGLLVGAGSVTAAVGNLIAVTAGNLVGGSLVGIGFWLAYEGRDRGVGSERNEEDREVRDLLS